LQKLKIVPKDVYPYIIDLTESPPSSPRVKQEPERDCVKQEDTTHAATGANIKREPRGDNSNGQTPFLPDPAPSRPAPNNESHNSSGQATNERDKKREAMEAELKAVELEQKRARLVQALAEM
jgi:hypothetical protein